MIFICFLESDDIVPQKLKKTWAKVFLNRGICLYYEIVIFQTKEFISTSRSFCRTIFFSVFLENKIAISIQNFTEFARSLKKNSGILCKNANGTKLKLTYVFARMTRGNNN